MVRYWNGHQWLQIPDGVTGPSGPAGPTGASGVAGPPGASGASGTPAPIGQDYFLYTQAVASGTWTINHTLNRPCAVTIVDADGTTIQADVYYPSTTQVLVEFTEPVAGSAYLT